MPESDPLNIIEGQAKLARIHQIVNECLVRRTAGEAITDDSIIAAHPNLMPQLAEWLHGLYLLDGVEKTTEPASIGRYRIEKTLGRGGFGRVFLAHDEQLGRPVAIKVPHRRLVHSPDQAEAYLAEARTGANLDHPHIVTVYDVGSTDEFPCYLVCQYIAGNDLAARIKKSPLNHNEAAELAATVAEALHYAHTQGLVHRDVKPSNILIDSGGRPYVADFGLALREEGMGQGPRYAGTPAYMSPEQAQGEGHRVDGRSDIFSLGVVLYELLAGRRPFRGQTQTELFAQVTGREPRPLRRHDDRIPQELERICQKALAKRIRDRYPTAKDLAEDLRHFLSEQTATTDSTTGDGRDSKTRYLTAATAEPTSASAVGGSSTATGAGSSLDSRPLKIVPKGLRSFGAHDADFFLELLPGPRDRGGLPESIRFWKTRIEETDPDTTFSVGLIYGPSGCGKSSLVQAGLLPILSPDVIAIYVEATAGDTETRLLHALRRHCVALEDKRNLQQILAALRGGQGTTVGKKVLIVLDQFEQWLHANREEKNADLVQALRHCDGKHLQCIVMVRDDFWLAATRFMDALEVDLRQGANTAFVDLFDVDHARKVLAAFGRAFGRLPEQVKDTSRQQREFLRQAVSGLADEDRVVCVRLALLAEMMKAKAWTPATLKSVGGIEGIGETFLEEAFGTQAAQPHHRIHQQAARKVLQNLLPESGSDIKGQMKSYDQLLDASGYARCPRDFVDLIRVLDSELRLITPTEECRVEGDGWRVEGDTTYRPDESTNTLQSPLTTIYRPPSTTRHYQLTHDYLVGPLRNWLTRKERETRRGRAELLLAERTTSWISKPENRHLPSLSEYLRIAGVTAHTKWNSSQRQMMQKAGRVLGLRWGIAVLVVFAIAGAVFHEKSKERRRVLSGLTKTTVKAMANSRGKAVPLVMKDLDELPRKMVLDVLGGRHAGGHTGETLPLGYALAHIGEDNVVASLIGQIAKALLEEVDNLVAALANTKHDSLLALRQAAAECDTNADWPFKARLAIVALHLGDLSLASDMCQIDNRPDPIQRSTFIKVCESWHGDLKLSNDVIAKVEDAALRSGLCSAVGSIAPDRLLPETKREWTSVFLDWYQRQPDAGTHSAAGWALRTWGEELPQVAPTRRSVEGRDWYVNTLDMTMLKIPKGNFKRADMRPSGFTPGDDVQNVILTRSFWLSDREVSIDAFRKFWEDSINSEDQKATAWSGRIWDGKSRTFRYWDNGNGDVHAADYPAHGVTRHNAILFCNWLSDKVELECCYIPTGRKELIQVELNGDPLSLDVWKLDDSADGYRLPTEAEWEYACRAGTETDYSFGDDVDLLEDYAIYLRNDSVLKRGMKLPNQWGVFDMHGGVNEICDDWWSESYGASETLTDPRVPRHAGGLLTRDTAFESRPYNPLYGDRTFNMHVLRGGGYNNMSLFAISAIRFPGFFGAFRVMRTAP